MLHVLQNRTSRAIIRSIVFLLAISPVHNSLWAQIAPSTTTSISNFNTHVIENMGTWAGVSSPTTGVTSWDMRGTGTRGSAFNGTDLSSGTSGGWYGNGNIAFLGSGTASAANATLRLQNVTGSTIAAFRLVYTGKMWRSNTGTPTVSVSWSKSSSSSVPTSGALTALASLGFSGATTDISTGVTFAQSVTSASIANNDYVFLRWIHSGGTNSDNLGWDDVMFIPQPITQVSAISFSAVGTNSMTVSWTAGNGRRRAVFMKATSAGTITNPSDGTLYTASTTFGSGTQLGTSGYYCVYDGTGTSVNVTGLAASTTYYVQAFEYNSDATPTAITATYLTTAVSASQATATPCVVPTVYTVTGTGSYCAGGSGRSLGLSGSQTGINYQLYNGSSPVGTALAGTGASPFTIGTYTAAGTYTVLATNSVGGCTSNMSGSAVVSINPLPTVGVSPVTASSCSSITATGADTYEWSPATGLSATTGATVVASPTVATTYTATGTDANGCINTATVSVVPATVNIAGISPAAGSAPQGTANQLLHTYTLGISGSDATLSGLTLSTYGSYVSTDVDNLKCWYSTSATFNAATATLLSSLNSPGVAGVKVFPSFSPQIIGSGVTGYLHITAEIGGSATGGNTIGIAATDFSGFTICAASLTGTNPVPASNLQTISASPCTGTPAAGTVTPASSFFCGSGSATLNLTGGATGSGLSYQWSSSASNTPPGTAISGATNESYTASSVTSTTYYWCTTTCGAASNISAVAVVSVNAVPSLSGATSSSPVCTGGTLSLFANSPSDVATYAWDGPSGFTSSLQNPTISSVSASASGTYTVTVNNGSGAGCSQTYTVDATVNDAPVSSGITVSGALCVGGTTTLNANSSDATSWSWSGPDGFTSTLTNPAITPTATGTYSLSLSSGVGSGCTPAVIYTTSVTVFPVPASTGATNSGPVCAGASVTLSANSTGATNWSWSGPSGYTSTLQNPSFSISGTGTYSLTVSRTGSGCSPITVYTTTVTVNALPTVTVTPTTGMAGSTFTASGAATYVWSPSGGLSATTGSSITATPSSATIYTVTGTSLAGCIGTATINVLPATGNLVWNYTALSPQAASSSNPAVVTASSCTATIGNSFGTVSSAINATSASSGYTGVTGGGNIGNAVALGAFSTSSAYINYLLTPNSGYCLTVTDVSFGTRSTGTGPQGYTITSDVAGFGSTVLASGTIPNTSTWTLASPTFTAVTGAPNTAINVRIFGHSGSGSPGSGSVNWRMDDVTFTYSVSPSPSLTSVSNNAPICTGNTLSLFANSPENVATYSWVGPNSFTSTEQNPSIPSVSMAAQGTYTVTVNNGSGCTKVYTTVVSLNATPSSTGPANSSPICAGSSVAFTANSSNANQWSWTGPGGFTSTLQNPSLPSASAGTYSLTLNNTVTGCSSTTVFSTVVTVNPIPVSSGATTDGIICAGEHTTIRANSTYANQWSWAGPSGFTSSDENPSVSPLASATYSVTLSNTLTGCSSSVVYTTSVTVNPAPTAAPTNNGPICSGGVVALSANTTLATSWSWTGPDGYTSSLENPTLTPTVTGVYSLTVASGTCSPATVYTTSVVVNTTPTAAPSNSGPICAGGTATLSANPAGGATTYAWSGPMGYTSTEANPTVSPTTTGTYSLTVTNGTTDAGCSPTTIYTTTVTVRAIPTAAPTNNGYICNGGTVSLTANGAGGASVFNWSGTSLSSSSVANPTATPTVTSVYSLTVSDGTTDAGCSPSTVYTTSVTVNATPTAAPTNSGPICVGGTVNLTANGAGGASVYNWSGTSLSSSTIANPTATPTVTGVYSLTVSDGSSQPGCSPATVYTTSVVVNTTPTAAPSNSGAICVGGSATLSANPAGGATTYAWSGPLGYTSTVENPVVSPTTTSTYSLTVSNGTADAGCSPSTVYTTTVTVRPAPTAAPTNNGYICNGGTVSLTANGAGGASVFNWSGTSLSSSSVANPTATPTATTVYSLTVSDGTADAGCSPSTVYTTSVTVNATPTAAPTNSGPICVGGTVNLTANGAGGASVYNWTGTSLSSSTIANPTATPTTTGVYSLTVSDGSGQPGCAPATVYTTSVVVNTTPTAAPSNSGPICVGGTATLSANPAGGATTYAWSGPMGYTSTVENPVVSPTTTGTYSLTVTNGTTDAGCSPSTVYTTTVTVRPTPTAAPTNNGYICNGGTVSLTANGANGASVFNWSGTSLSSSSIANPTATPTATTIYSLTVSDGTTDAGCSPSTVYTTSVTVNAQPTAAPTNSGPICVGGTVNLTANGAGGASVYNWTGTSLSSSTIANPTATPTTTGVYSLTVSDGSGQPGCSPATVYTTSVTVNTTPTAAPSNSGPICVGGTATLSANPSGGATTYVWSGPMGYTSTVANPVVSPTTTSTYSLTVTNGTTDAGCSPNTIYTTTVTVRPTPTAAPTNNGYICNGGTVSLTANGANGATVFNWSGTSLSSSSIANPTATPTATTVYSLTVSDGTADAGCSPSTVYTTSVTVNAQPTAAPTNSGPICVGGTVNLTANGAGGASVYNWSGTSLSSSSIANPNATPTVTGVYSLTVSDGSSQPGCSPATVYTISVVVNTTPTAAPSNSGPICVGGSATLSANPAGGATTYAWSGPSGYTSTEANPVVSPTTTGTYSLTVSNGTADAGCSPSTVYTTTVTVRPTPTAAPTNNGYICNGGTVSLTANGAGGASVYNWSGTSLSSSSVANPTATPTVNTVYSLTVSDGTADAGCSPTTVYTTSVTVNAQPTAAPTNSGPICVGGTVNLTANGAGGASVYNWSGTSLSSSSIANPNATPTVTGVYSLTVSDGSSQPGCSPATVYTTSVVVNTTPTAAPSNSGPICVGGTATLSANPAGGATTYAWSGPLGYTSTVENPIVSPTTTSTYSLTVSNGTADAGCSPSTVYTTSVTVRPTPTAAPTNNGYICNGGTVSLTANGAGGATVFNWSGSSLSSSSVANPTATPTANTVYSLTVSDGTTDAGCSPSTVYTTSVTVNATPTAAPSNSGPICVGGTVNLTANGAGGASVYNWSGVSLSSSSIANPTATPTVTGVYSLTVSDGSGQPGCAPATVYTTSVTVNTTPTAAPTNSGPICVGGSAMLSANPAGGATTYAWSGPSGYTSTDANPVVSPTTTGTYSLTVTNGTTDAGCSPTTIYTTTVTVRPTPTAAPTNNGYICNGGTVSLTANGAGGASVYNWSGSSLSSSSVANPTATPTVTSVYSLTVSDGTTDAGCSPSTVYTTSVTVNATPTAAPTNSGPICVGGTVNLTANGTGGASVYNWSGVSLSSSSIANPTATPTVTGVYSLTVSDGSGQPGCSPATVYTTSVTVNTTPTAAPSNSGPICVGGTATLSANPSGGATTYVWSGPMGYTSTVANPVVSPTTTSTYSLTVSNGTADAGCSPSTVYTTTVTVRPTPTAAPTNNGYICNGGTVSLTANGAGGATVFNWSGSSLSSSSVANPTATPTVTSVYSLTVSDGTADAGCSPSTVYTTSVTVNATPTAAPTNSGPICVGGTVNLTANGTGGASVYNWSGSALSSSTIANPTATPTVTGVYSLTVSDGSGQPGCSPATVYTTSVVVNTTPTAAPTNSGAICVGGTATLSANPAGGATTYVWSGPMGYTSTVENPVVSPTTTGTYSLTVTNGTTDAGCSPTTIYTTTVTVRPTPTAAPTNNGYICNGGTVSLTANGANGATVFNWSGTSLSSSSIANPTATPTATTVYSLTVSDGTADAGCSPSTVYTTSVTVNAQPTAAPSNSGPICVGGTVNLTANGAGGASVYNWSGSALSSSTIANPTATPTVTGVYSLTVSDGSSQPGCSPATVYTTSVTVNTTPTAAPSNSGAICVGGTATLSANPAGGATTYAWSGPMGYTSTVENPVVSPTTTGTYSLTVTNGTADAGCSPSTVYTTTVTVRPTPTAAPTNNGYICNGGTVSLTANGAGGASVFNWSGTSLSSSSVANPTATPTVTSVYSLTVSDGTTDAGCSPSTVYTTSVTVNAQPTAAASNSGPICSGGTVNLSANATGGATVYNWSGVSLSSSTIANPTATPTTTGVYSLTVSDGSSQPGCAPATVYTTSVTVIQLPVVGSVTGVASVCAGSTTTLSNSVPGGTWASDNESIATVGTMGTVSGIVAGTATISYTVTNTCGSATAVQVVTVNPLPDAGSISGDTTVCAGATTTLSSTSVGGNWTSSNIAVASVGSSGIVTGVNAGSANISYTVSNSCGIATIMRMVTVNVIPPAGTITGVGSVCAGETIMLSNVVSGGEWFSSNTTVATIETTGVVSGLMAGTSTVSYTVTGICGSATTTKVITVNVIPVVATVTGTMSPICPGTTTTFANTTVGGTWSSSHPSVAVVNVAGVITGISAGISNITYTAGNICGSTFATKEVTVNPAPPTVSISGPVSVTLGSTIDLVGNPSGGVWSSLSPSMATVSPAGVVTGVSASVGTTVITYAASNYCGTRTATKLVLVNAITGTDIFGTYSVCVGKTTNLSNSVAGGTWTSSNTSTATVSSTGIVTGLAAGTVTILYIKATSISAAVITVNPLPTPISGSATVCAGSTTALTSSEGGSWNSSNPLAATVDASGIVTGNAAGTPIITYQTIDGCIATKIMSVHPLPANPSGLTSVCESSSVTFTNSASGTWSSSNTDIATVPATPGMVTGIAAGVATISFRAASTGCYSTKSITVKPLPSGITGATNVCVGSNAAYFCTTPGGVWTKTSVPAAALSINTSGVASGYTAGTAMLTYAVDGCIATRPVTVSPLPGTISATSATLCIGSSVTLSSPVPGGTWTSGNETVATVSSGTVSGNSAGTATISYTSAAGCYSVYTVTVNTPPTVTASGTTCVGSNTILTSSVSGTWSVANSSIATISASGLVNGVSAGTTTVTFRTSATCFTTGVFTVTPAPDPIAGPDKVCIGSDIVLTHGSAGGTWSSSAPSKGSIGTDGTLRGLSAGSTTVTYVTTSGCITTALISVNAVPNPISGGAILCEGNTTVLSNSTPSGTWTSDGVAASVVAGTVTGITSGTSAITYTVPSTGCMTTRIVTVQPNPSITAASTGICVGETTTLTATPSGGSWTSGNTTVATIGLYTGVVTGSGTGGVTSVTYSLPTGCRSITTVNVLPKPTVVSGGSSSFCAGTFINLVTAEAGITWASSDISVADIATMTPLMGRVDGYTPGTATISYTNAAGCGRSLVVTVTAAPSSISGIDEICVGCVAAVANATTGGTWSSSNASRAVIVSATGQMTGMSAGTVTVSYRTSPTCYVTKVVTVVAPSPIAIDGPNGVCVASSATYTHATTGGTWGISLSGFATINTGTGLVTGVAQGTSVITYFITPGNYVTKNITVYPYVFPINGTYSVCVGASTTLNSAQTGGTWSISNTAVGSIGNLTGLLTGLSDGTATVTYTNPYSGCYSLRTVTVHPLPAAISGASALCVGSNITLVSATTGGTWYSSAGIYATINPTSGVVNGVAASPLTITYMSGAGCITTKNLTVNPLPAPITGSATLGTVTGTTTTLSSLPSTGTWSSSDAGVATIGLTSGVISSVGIGTSVITYTLPGTGCYRTRVQTVVAGRPGEVNRNMNVDDHVSIYPSPTSGTIHLNTEVGGELMVLSLDGKVVATYHAMAGAQSFTFASDIAAGVYVCRFVAADGNIYQTKIVYQP